MLGTGASSQQQGLRLGMSYVIQFVGIRWSTTQPMAKLMKRMARMPPPHVMHICAPSNASAPQHLQSVVRLRRISDDFVGERNGPHLVEAQLASKAMPQHEQAREDAPHPSPEVRCVRSAQIPLDQKPRRVDDGHD